MIREDKISIWINRKRVYPTAVSITKSIGRGYNICNLSGANLDGEVGDKVKLEINKDELYFYIAEKSVNDNKQISLTCFGYPFTLENEAESDESLPYQNSYELIEGERGNIEVVNNLPNIDFKGKTYIRPNTPLGRIKDMVNVVAGEIYEDNRKLVLDLQKAIPENPIIKHTFSDNEVTSFSYRDTIRKQALVKEVVVNPTPADIYSQDSVIIDYREDTKCGKVYFNPSLSQNNKYSANGLALQKTRLLTQESIKVDNAYYIKTKGGIDSISSIKLNDSIIQNDNFIFKRGYNAVIFKQPMNGNITIEYATTGAIFRIYKTTAFNIYYGCAKIEDTITIGSGSGGSGGSGYDGEDASDIPTCGSGKGWGKIVNPITYEDGGKILIPKNTNATIILSDDAAVQKTTEKQLDSYIKIKYLHGDGKDTSFLDNISISNTTQTCNYTNKVYYDDDIGDYILPVSDDIQQIDKIEVGGNTIDGSDIVIKSHNGIRYISLGEQYNGKNATIWYSKQLKVVNLPSMNEDNVNKTSLTTDNTTDETYTEHKEDTYCSLPARVEVDVAYYLDVPLDKVIGKTLTCDGASLDVDNQGKIYFNVTEPTLYKIDCSNIIKKSYIYIDATGVV